MPAGGNSRFRGYPARMSERQQLALLLQMTSQDIVSGKLSKKTQFSISLKKNKAVSETLSSLLFSPSFLPFPLPIPPFPETKTMACFSLKTFVERFFSWLTTFFGPWKGKKFIKKRFSILWVVKTNRLRFCVVYLCVYMCFLVRGAKEEGKG